MVETTSVHDLRTDTAPASCAQAQCKAKRNRFPWVTIALYVRPPPDTLSKNARSLTGCRIALSPLDCFLSDDPAAAGQPNVHLERAHGHHVHGARAAIQPHP